MSLRTFSAIFATSICLSSAVHAQEVENIDTVGREFLGIMKQKGYSDARYDSILGDETAFEIKGFKGSKKTADGKSASFSIAVLNVQGLVPDDRWTRAEAVRADGVRLASGETVYEFGTIYANKAGIRDVDSAKPSITFGTMILKDAGLSEGPKKLLSASDVYASADRWVNDYGVPGKLDLTLKGAFVPSLLSSFAVPLMGGDDLVVGELALKTSLSSTRDEMSLTSKFAAHGKGAYTLEAILTDFDRGLFQSWFDLDNPDDDRTAEKQKEYQEAFDKEFATVGIKSFDIKLFDMEWAAGDSAKALGAIAVNVLPTLVDPASSKSLIAGLTAFAANPTSFSVSAISRAGVKFGNLIGNDRALPITGFQFIVGK